METQAQNRRILWLASKVPLDISVGICGPRIAGREGAMPGSRTWNRRETNVAQAGFFTVLRSTGWFSSTLHLPGGYRYVTKGPATPDCLQKPEGVPSSEGRNGSNAQDQQASVQLAMPWAHEHRLVRMALVAIAGVTITLGLIWWLWHAGA